MRRVLYLLGELADEDIDWLTVAGTAESYAPGQALIEEGRQPDSLFVILEGEALISVATPQPRDLGISEPGEILGELSFLDSRPASATVRASTPLTALRIRRAAMVARLASDRDFAARFYRALAVFLAQRLRQRTAHIGHSAAAAAAAATNDDDELSPELLDQTAMAGKRADWIKTRLLGR
ncbi:MAG: cyclic nucleotide-binding domain-containing protein [Gemmataceae bacterium]|nr:cyclic nucleotide-binding domain-containing protein [Gemmataceae bacterium]